LIIRFAGFGGQGIVLSSFIIGQSAVFDGKRAIQCQSYGSEARGGECCGDVIISAHEIYELEPINYDILVALTQPAYERFIHFLKPKGTLIIDTDLVTPNNDLRQSGIKTYGIRATDTASRKIGHQIVANMVILGFMNSLLKITSRESLEKAISQSVPKGTVDLNLKAMRVGIKMAEEKA
jgi:2-oxoglutarate ferredoxin oxidoreductase subunit gamma